MQSINSRYTRARLDLRDEYVHEISSLLISLCSWTKPGWTDELEPRASVRRFAQLTWAHSWCFKPSPLRANDWLSAHFCKTNMFAERFKWSGTLMFSNIQMCLDPKVKSQKELCVYT